MTLVILCPKSSRNINAVPDPTLSNPKSQYAGNTTPLHPTFAQEMEAYLQRRRLIERARVLRQGIISRRDEDLMTMGKSCCLATGDDSLHPNPHVRQLLRTCFPDSKFSVLESQNSPECVPLNECVLAIAWEAILCPLSHSLFSGVAKAGNIEALAKLLPCVAAYQAKYHRVWTTLHARVSI